MVTPKHDEGKIGISGVLCIAEKINGVRDIIESVDVELEFMMPGREFLLLHFVARIQIY